MNRLAQVEQILLEADTTIADIQKRIKERYGNNIPKHSQEREKQFTKTCKIEAFDKIHKILIEDEEEI